MDNYPSVKRKKRLSRKEKKAKIVEIKQSIEKVAKKLDKILVKRRKKIYELLKQDSKKQIGLFRQN